jgi:3-deoxy-D-manno-octulosonic-acid transferase
MDEEEKALNAHDLLRREIPDALLLLVPRHPERFAYVASLLSKRGYSYVTRSSGARCTENTQVFLGNTLGELPVFYAASDIAFVGGSLVPVGGHNLLEPAVLGLPVITGPHTFNAEDIALLFNENGAAITVQDERELGEQLLSLFADPENCAKRGEQGRKTVEENRGALGRLLALVEPLVENPLAQNKASESQVSKG